MENQKLIPARIKNRKCLALGMPRLVLLEQLLNSDEVYLVWHNGKPTNWIVSLRQVELNPVAYFKK